MDDRNDIHSPDEQKNPMEIPSNEPESETQPIRASDSNRTDEATKHRQRMRGVKIAYAVALLFAVGGALTAKIATENALEGFNATFPNEEITLPATTQGEKINIYDATEEPDFEVRQNLTDVPDTRLEESETEPETKEETTQTTTEKSEYAIPYSDYYTLPLGTDITKDYSPETPIYNSTMGDWRTHAGIDFKGADGAQVLAISYGKVSKVYNDPLYGTVVEINHGNEVIAKYCGLNKDVLEVKAGDTVKAGTLIGYLDSVPCEKSDLSHLHFEVIYKGENVDPLELMGK